MKSNTLKIHLDILDSARKELLDRLTPLSSGFVMGGGTALALQLAHRKSFDFDFFSQSPIPKNFLNKLSSSIQVENIVVDTADELTIFTKDAVKLTFLYYPFTHYFKSIELSNGLNLYSVPEIALHKAYTIGRRGEYRDYFDLYTILNGGYIELQELISATKEVHGSVFDEKIFLQQLVYFGDLTNFDIIPASTLSLPALDEIRRYFEELLKDYVH